MRNLLLQSNGDLLHQLATLQRLLGEARVPPELTAYRGHIERLCEELRLLVRRNQKDLEYDQPDTFVNVLNQTQRATQLFELVNSRYAGPIIRSREEDRLGLIVLRWLHDEHQGTAGRPFALSDGVFAIYPHEEWPALFFLPSSRQRTLPYLPLLFHEFGHLLYVLHLREMDELVAEFQGVVSDALAPKTVRGRGAKEKQEDFRRRTVLAWYEWAQEFFCDAIGLQIGGPSYLKSFMGYFRVRSTDNFYMPRNKQLEREHPVTWLRVRMLADRCKLLGIPTVGEAANRAWETTAQELKIREDYEGTWSEDFFVPLRKMLDDMVEEANPRRFTPTEANPTTDSLDVISVVNRAWLLLEAPSDVYAAWERQMIQKLLDSR